MLAPEKTRHSFKQADFKAWEAELVLEAQKGSRSAQETLYRTFARPLYETVIRPRLRDEKGAEDVLADTFEAVLTKLDSYKNEGQGFWAWLCTVAIHKVYDLQRKTGRQARVEDVSETASEAVVLALRVGPDVVSGGIERAEIRTRVERCLVAVNPRYAHVIRLRFFEERERVDCAEALAVSVATFDVLLLRAVRAFRDKWTERPSYPEMQ